ncbi:LOW QUALITY PROTEIN: hypothetical protein PHMEG_0004756 [Phytophthora megakarya]|uniref:Uncharacterized protein n=1 Tax=Phytophthora megakarya TaxID=4795 RepID=A0A225WT32_9STRA|nr:LOW QUALITY PROTEIN: hypothetical protein PHMEG_0004756 [Phytophthora megakarya]
MAGNRDLLWCQDSFVDSGSSRKQHWRNAGSVKHECIVSSIINDHRPLLHFSQVGARTIPPTHVLDGNCFDEEIQARKHMTKKEVKTVQGHQFSIPPDIAGPEQTIPSYYSGNMDGSNTGAFAVKWRMPCNLSLEPSAILSIVVRRIHGEKQPISAPELVRDYHRSKGDVDIHDQLRL